MFNILCTDLLHTQIRSQSFIGESARPGYPVYMSLSLICLSESSLATLCLTKRESSSDEEVITTSQELSHIEPSFACVLIYDTVSSFVVKNTLK